MENTYRQKLTIDGNRVVITYNFREVWQRLMNGHMQPPVVVKVYPENPMEKEVLVDFFNKISRDIVFIIREYISVVRRKFIGIDFKYQLVNHTVKYEDGSETIEYYRAELYWYYND